MQAISRILLSSLMLAATAGCAVSGRIKSIGKAAEKLSPLKVGPLSVGYRLFEDGVAFGGKRLTATEIAIAAGKLVITGTAREASST